MKKLFFILGLIGTAFLAYYSISHYSIKIQDDIKSRLTQSLEGKNISNNINMEVSGRDVILTGAVSEEQAKIQAGQIALKLEGVRAVKNQIQVVVPPPMMAAPEAKPSTEEDSLFNLDIIPDAEDSTVTATTEPIEPEPVAETETEIDAETELFEPDVSQEVVVDPIVAVDDVQLDEPLAIQHRNIVRRDVDSITAQKTVEAECENNLTSLRQGDKIYFDSGRATIKSQSYDLLDRIIVAAKNCHEDTIITVNGYTDNTGDMQANRQLSLERARAVGRYMLERGVAKQVKVVGHGSNDPIASNDTEEGRAQNRRIEFKVFKVETE